MTQYARRQTNGADTAQRHRLTRSGLVTPTGALTSRDGVIGLAVGGASGMSRTVGPGRAVIQGDASGTQGVYEYVNDAAVTVTFDAGDAQARVDLIVVRVRQNDADASGQTDAALTVVKGSAGGGAPAVPNSCVPVWEQPIPANASAGTGGIPAGTDRRPPPPIATGGRVPVANAADRDTLFTYPGLQVYRLDTKVGQTWDGTAWINDGDQPWTAYTPVLSADGGAPTISDGTLVGAFQRIGRTVHTRIRLTLGPNTNFGTGGIHLTLPVAPLAAHRWVFPADYWDISAGIYGGRAIYDAVQNRLDLVTEPATAGGLSRPVSGASNVPFGWANGDVVTDLLTDQPLGWIPAGGVSYSRRIGGVGDFTGGFNISSQRLGDIARTLNDRPCGLYAYRGRSVWWGGIVWAAPIKLAKRGQSARCDLTAATFDSLPDRRRIFDDHDLGPVDRGEALAQLWDRMQAASASGPTAQALVEVGAPAVGGESYDASYEGAAATTYAEAMKQIADIEPAVEWTIDVWADENGLRHRRLRVGTPLLGRRAPTADWRPLLLVTPSTLTGMDAVGDHTARPTHLLGRGTATSTGVGGETEPLTTGVLVDGDAVTARAPRVDGVYDLATEDEARLRSETIDYLGGPNRIPQLSVSLPATSEFHPGQVGDIARAQVDGFIFPRGRLDTIRRLIGVRVEPAERGRSEKVTFTFHDPYTAGAA